MLRNKVGPVLNFENVSFLLLFVLKIVLFSAGRTSFCKYKKTKNLDQFVTLKRAQMGPAFNFAAHIYIYIPVYIYVVELKVGPRFGRL